MRKKHYCFINKLSRYTQNLQLNFVFIEKNLKESEDLLKYCSYEMLGPTTKQKTCIKTKKEEFDAQF